MNMKKNIINLLVLALSLFCLLVGGGLFLLETNPKVYNALAQTGLNMTFLDNLGRWEDELEVGSYYSLVDESGKELDQVGRQVYIGDEFILENNRRYKVTKIDEERQQAITQLVGVEEISYREEWDAEPATRMDGKYKEVAVYMTHTDESYVPTDGTHSKPGSGGILQVGNTLANSLKEKGVESNISFNKHDPHDANAYHRSRKTAVQLLKDNPVALIDVHRDGIPDPNFYKTEINGQTGTKIRLVVGRQNANMSANLDFAKRIKAYFDKHYPGFIKGIYIGKGNYNQDLGPQTMLIEVGTHTNSRTAAERGVSVFAEGIPKVVGAATGAPVGPTGAARPGVGRALLTILAIAVVGGGAFLLLSTGSLKGSWAKISGLGKEFSNYFGPSRTKLANPPESSPEGQADPQDEEK
ncbi:MAG TPA: stage II sporulation protein P [Clostridia bacterium]|nr:stage II sporulation protein P [Clostridia bacterium]